MTSAVPISAHPKYSLHAHAARALQEHVYRFTVGIIDWESHDAGTGTLFDFGDLILIATAGHLVPNSANTRLSIFGSSRERVKDGDRHIIRWNRHPSIDVGYLQISRELCDRLAKRPCELSRIDVTTKDRSHALSMLVGLPTDPNFMRIDPDSRTIRGAFVSYSNTPLSPKEARALTGLLSPYRPRTDILMGYDKNNAAVVENEHPGYVPDPFGFSGGGLWSYPFKQRKYWSPDIAKVFAIDTSWDAKNNIIRAVKIVHWLRLVYAEFPDIRDHLTGAFPRTKLV